MKSVFQKEVSILTNRHLQKNEINLITIMYNNQILFLLLSIKALLPTELYSSSVTAIIFLL